MLVTIVLLFAIGAYMTHSRNEARKIADAKELAEKKAEALIIWRRRSVRSVNSEVKWSKVWPELPQLIESSKLR